MKQILLTDITLHSNDGRPTANLEKAAQRKEYGFPSPRLYMPQTSPDDFKIFPDGRFEIALNFPPDVLRGIESGEIKVVIPEGGIKVYPGKDLIEKFQQEEEKARRELIHRSRGQVWRKE